MKEPVLKVVLATLNAKYVHAATAPYCLLAGLRAFAKSPTHGTVIEGTVKEDTAAVASRILAAQPRLVALSVYIWNRRETAALIAALREADPTLTLVAGGPEVDPDAEAFLLECPVDAVLVGEGERPIALLADALSEGRPIAAVPGAVTRTGRVPPLPAEPCPPSAVLPEYLTAVRSRIAYLETSRGCPFHCAFCLSGGTGVRFFPLDRVKREMLALAGAGVRTVKLVDRTFNADRARARDLWRFVIAEQGRGIPHGVSFHFEVAGDLLGEEDLAILAAAPPGAIRLEIGIQSFHAPTLAAVCRRTDPERVGEWVARLVALLNIEVHIDLIAGLPHENMATFRAGFLRALSLRPSMLQLGFLKLLHGSRLRREPPVPLTAGKEPPYEVTATPTMTEGELSVLHALEDALDALYNSHRFSRTLAYLFEECGLDPFAFLSAFGAATPAHKTPLDAYTEAFFHYAVSYPAVDARRLRDRMLADRLATTPDHALPPSLYAPDERLGYVKKSLQKRYREEGKTHRIGVGLLYTTGEVMVAEYTERHPITGEFPSHTEPMP